MFILEVCVALMVYVKVKRTAKGRLNLTVDKHKVMLDKKVKIVNISII